MMAAIVLITASASFFAGMLFMALCQAAKAGDRLQGRKPDDSIFEK